MGIFLAETKKILVLVGLLSGFLPLVAWAGSSRDDLAAKMLTSLEGEIPAEVKTLGFWYLENDVAPSLDIELLREDLEIAIINSDRFDFVDRDLLARALQEANLCQDLGCLINPEFVQKVGKARGIDALVYGEVTDASEGYPTLRENDYFVTVLMKAISTSTSAVIWSKEITGLNIEAILARIGRLPTEESLYREEGFAREVARFMMASGKIREANIRTLLLLEFEDKSGHYKETEKFYRALSQAMVQDTDLKLIDRGNMRRLLEEQQLAMDNILDQGWRSRIGQLYGADAFISGTIREVTPQQIKCSIKVSDVETNIGVEAKVLTGRSKNPELKLVNVLLNAGPTLFKSTPPGADVRVDQELIGKTPIRHQLGDGTYTVTFTLPGYAPVTKQVEILYGQAKEVSVKLGSIPCLLSITTEPSGANVNLDDEPLGESPIRGATVNWGQRQLKIVMEDYVSVRETLNLPSGSYSRHFVLEPQPCELTITTDPSGATVILRGEKLGITPIRNVSVPRGPGQIEVQKLDYYPITQDLELPAGRLSRSYELEAMPCYFSVTTDPSESSVFLDGEKIGKSPLTGVSVPHGRYKLRIEGPPLYEGIYRTIELPVGEFKQQFSLEPTFGTLIVETSPQDGGWISINEEVVKEQTTPARLEFVSAGRKEITVGRCGCFGSSTEITVDRGEETRIRLNLFPKTRSTAFKRSLLLPGLGQHYKNQSGRAWFYHFATAGGIAVAVLGQTNRGSSITDYNEAVEAYNGSVVQSDMDHWFGEMETRYDDIEGAENLRNIGLYTVAGIWLMSALDAVIGSPLKCDDDPSVLGGLLPIHGDKKISAKLALGFQRAGSKSEGTETTRGKGINLGIVKRF